MYPTDPVEIEIGGAVRHLRYTLADARRIKAKLGKSLVRGDLLDIDEDALPELIAAGLVEKDLTAEQVAEMIDLPSLPSVAEKFIEAMVGRSALEVARKKENPTVPASAS